MMKQISNCILIVACTLAAVWLYQIQFGAVAFILLSFFLFYRSFIELRKKKEKAKTSPKEIPEKADKKKAEIVT